MFGPPWCGKFHLVGIGLIEDLLSLETTGLVRPDRVIEGFLRRRATPFGDEPIDLRKQPRARRGNWDPICELHQGPRPYVRRVRRSPDRGETLPFNLQNRGRPLPWTSKRSNKINAKR